MKISDILDESLVKTRLPGNTKDEVIAEMIDLVGASKKVLDKEKVRDAIFEREKIMSTGVGNGFAIPHGKTDAVSDIVAAFAIEPFAAFLARFKKHLARVEHVMGALLVLTGVAFLTGSVTQMSVWLLETFPILGKIG